MVNSPIVNIYLPVKDALDTAEQAIRCLAAWGVPFTIWNDRSTDENTARLHALQQELGFRLIDVATITDHPSPNYRMLLVQAQREALETNRHLVIVESDVLVRPDTLERMLKAAQTPQCGMVAAITHDADGNVNFPYLYARKYPQDQRPTTKRLSFCCTLITNAFLQAFDFDTLNTDKDWFDVTISNESRKHGFINLLLTDTPVTHMPHSSRPWKQLKYTNPLKYYWLKLIRRRDKI